MPRAGEQPAGGRAALAIPENQGVVEAEDVPPRQRNRGSEACVGVFVFELIREVQRRSSIDSGGAARRGAPWMNCLSVDMYGYMPYT